MRLFIKMLVADISHSVRQVSESFILTVRSIMDLYAKSRKGKGLG